VAQSALFGSSKFADKMLERWRNAGLRVMVCSVFLAGATPQQIGALPPGEFYWEPELSPSGWLVILISLPEQTLALIATECR
jgi:hypothetical protein